MATAEINERLLVTSAGAGPSNNLMRSLKAGDPSLFIVGCHADRFVLKKSPADRNYLIPRARREGEAALNPDFRDAIHQIVNKDHVDLLIPGHERDVWDCAILKSEGDVACRVFLPNQDVIQRCQDKYELTTFLRKRSIPAPLTYPIESVSNQETMRQRVREQVEAIFHKLAPASSSLWCRIRRGFGSRGATKVKDPAQACSWIMYWNEMRGVDVEEFTLSEYLPGKDYNVQGLWKKGAPVLLKMCERLSYFGGDTQPSGMSSTPALAKTVLEPRALQVCEDAIQALDAGASGVFNFDLKEDASGVPCITEVNAGRFAMITNIYDLVGEHNMAISYVRLALDKPLQIRQKYDIAEDYYLVRDLDTLPGVFHVDEFYEAIETLRN